MKKNIKRALVQASIVILTAIILSLFTAKVLEGRALPIAEAEPIKVEIITHRQKVWLGALEWCESRGVGEAINKVDKDGTPSYYWLQFKPGTFRGYGEKYGLIEKGKSTEQIMELMKSYELTIAIMENMIADPTITDKQWRYSLFPGCTAKLGTPPRT